MDTVKLKLNRTNELLVKLRHNVNSTLYRTICYPIFEPYFVLDVNYGGKHKHKSYKILKKPKTKPEEF